jgi:hypothetical protein
MCPFTIPSSCVVVTDGSDPPNLATLNCVSPYPPALPRQLESLDSDALPVLTHAPGEKCFCWRNCQYPLA